MHCSECGADVTGAYCPSCGAPAGGPRCRHCDADLPVNARFCTQCGRSTRAVASALPWLVAGTAVVALVVVLVAPLLRGPEPEGTPVRGTLPSAAVAPAGPPTGTNPPPLTGTPREQADRLFNRVMQARASGSAEEATFFLPMAIAAYQQAGELDADGLFHLSLLQTAAGQASAGRASAERILATSPTHLLGLAAAAQAASAAGDPSAAAAYWRRYLDAYDAEAGRDLPEYTDHRASLAEYRIEAEAAL